HPATNQKLIRIHQFNPQASQLRATKILEVARHDGNPGPGLLRQCRPGRCNNMPVLGVAVNQAVLEATDIALVRGRIGMLECGPLCLDQSRLDLPHPSDIASPFVSYYLAPCR